MSLPKITITFTIEPFDEKIYTCAHSAIDAAKFLAAKPKNQGHTVTVVRHSVDETGTTSTPIWRSDERGFNT